MDSSVALNTLLVLALSFTLYLWRRRTQGSAVPRRKNHISQQETPEVDPQIQVTKELDAPEGWFSDAKTFELERRAIFSQTWLCITHVSHFRKPGDYLSFTIADFPFFLIMGKDDILRGFHNVCRHRAYEVTRKVMGSSLVLGCRYHGWSYDTKGNLTKAPQFDNVLGFQKEDNGLFQIWVRTDANGFVFINLDAKWDVFDPPTNGLNAFAEYCGASKESSYVAFWQTEADMNWKQANALLERSEVAKIRPKTQNGLFANLAKLSRAIPSTSALFFPSSVSSLCAVGGTPFWHMTVVEPITATRCSIRRTLYNTRPDLQTGRSKVTVLQLEEEFERLVKELERQYREILDSEGSIVLSSSQKDLRKTVRVHLKNERAMGREITPALPLQIAGKVNSSSCGIAEKLCRELDALADEPSCGKPGRMADRLAW